MRTRCHYSIDFNQRHKARCGSGDAPWLRLSSDAGDRHVTQSSRISVRCFGLDAIRDIQVLRPMNRGGVGARSLNIELQAALNPAGDRKVERFGWTFAPGDKVMQVENDYDKEVYNGDIGTIDDVDPAAGRTHCHL
jgi:ATP-dependent exoDNAse (exonuclease V) alpha subunit